MMKTRMEFETWPQPQVSVSFLQRPQFDYRQLGLMKELKQ